ncbi:unnamed protein product [Boreogadus saida]
MMLRFYFVKQINGDRAENVVGDRQDRETGTGDRRTRIQRGETGNVVGDRQDREAGTEDRRTRIQKDKAGNVVGKQAGKEQEAIVGRTRRAVSSRPELEDALPEWAVELLSPTVFWPESYMPVPPDFAPALTPVPEPCPVPEPTPRLPEGTGLFAYLRWSALRPCLWRSALCSCRRWPALQTIQGRHALRSCLRGPAPCSFQRGTGLCSCRRWPALQTIQGRNALRSCLWGPSSSPSRGGFPFKAFLQRGPALYLAFHQRGPTLDLAFHQRGPALYLSFLQRGPALHRAFLLRGPALYLAFAGLLKGSAFPLPLLAPQAVRLRLPAMPWGSFLAARLTSLRSAPLPACLHPPPP